MFILVSPANHLWVGAILLSAMSSLAPLIDDSFGQRLMVLLIAICAARLGSQTVAPLAAILFKWVVIGRYKPGTYKL